MELQQSAGFSGQMEPIDRRTTAATLLAMRSDANAADAIALKLNVNQMNLVDATRTRDEIAEFLESGDATRASQLIHSATVRTKGARRF